MSCDEVCDCSVGRPKDLDPRAAYVRLTVDGEDVHTEIRRVSYDVEKVVGVISEGGLDLAFAEFLRNGGDPNASSAPMVCDLTKSRLHNKCIRIRIDTPR